MQALEFESSVEGDQLKIPAHLAKQIPAQSRVKVIMLMEEKNQPPADNLQQRLLAISQRYAALPDKDDRSSDEILGYDEQGLPS